jgi:hypothetical protein
MTEENQELFFDLLTKKAVYGLDDAEQQQLDYIDTGTAETEFRSLEISTAAISMVGLSADEPLPGHLYSKIATDATRYVGAVEAEPETPWTSGFTHTIESKAIFADEPARPWFGWLGWAAAAAACIALAVNIWLTRIPAIEQAKTPPQIETPQILTPAEMRERMLRSTAGMIKANWAAGNVKEMKDISGDVVWSDEQQSGYMRFRGLPVNDANKETYQLWIFDKTQDKATPIDGGTFDVKASGEVVIPVRAKLKAQGPEMFAVTIEKPGGVVVSKREKIAVIAKVETAPG